MSDTTTLRDHTQPCEHFEGEEQAPMDLSGNFYCDIEGCPGGRERTFREEYENLDGTSLSGGRRVGNTLKSVAVGWPAEGYPRVRLVSEWVEVTDE